MFKSILVAYDGSSHAEAALRAACHLARHDDSRLRIVHVPELHTAAIAVGATAVEVPVHDDRAEALAKQRLAEAVSLAASCGHAADSSEVLYGDAAEVILKDAERFGADLIVSGRRGTGQLKGLLLGSVTQKLSAHADCAVLTVK